MPPQLPGPGGAPGAAAPTGSTERPASWEDVISHFAKAEGIPPQLAIAVARRESRINPNTPPGDAGKAIGMFQIHPDAMIDVGMTPDERSDPYKNIRGGVRYLKLLSDRYQGDVNRTLWAYNGGARNVDQNTVSPAAQAYASEVLVELSQYARQGATAPVPGRAGGAGPAGQPQGPARAGGPGAPVQTGVDLGGGAPLDPAGFGRSLVEQFNPATPAGRANITGTAASTAASVATRNVGGPGIAPWLTRVIGPPAAAAVASGAERGIEQAAGVAQGEPGAVETGVTQGAYELGGQALFWPVRRLFKSLIAPRVGRAAKEGVEAGIDVAKTEGAAGVRAARELSAATTERTQKDVANQVAQIDARRAAGITGAEQRGAAAVAAARKSTAAAIVQQDIDNAAAIDAIKRQYDNLLAVSPSREGAVALTRDALEGPAKKALDQAGERVFGAAQTGPPIDMKPIVAELQKITRRAKPETLFPSHAPKPAAGFIQIAPRGQDLAAAARGTTRITREQYSELIKGELNKAPQDRLPLNDILNRLADAPDDLAFADAHALKRLLDETVNWDQAARKINQQLTKGIRTTLREAMAVHEPYNVATGAYRALATLYRKGTGAKVSRALINNPDAAARVLDSKNPIAAQSLYDLLVTQSAAGGDPILGQRAWDAVRSTYLYDNLLSGGVDKLSTRVRQMVMESPEFAKVVFGDEAGQRIVTNLDMLGQAFQTAQAQAAERAAATKAAGKATVEGAKEGGEALRRVATQAGTQDVSAARQAAAEAIRQSRRAGRTGVEAAKETAAAGVTAAEAEKTALRRSTLGPYAARTMESEGADVLRGFALGPKSIWGAVSLMRLLNSPRGADLLQYISYSDALTQKVVQAMLGQMPDRAAGFLVRDVLGAINPPMPSHTPGAPAAPAPVGPTAAVQ